MISSESYFDLFVSKFLSATLKGQCDEIFASEIFHESSSIGPLIISLAALQTFQKIQRYSQRCEFHEVYFYHGDAQTFSSAAEIFHSRWAEKS